MKVFDYIYYKYFRFFNSFSDEMPDFIAMMAVCWLLFMNSYALMALIVVQFELNIVEIFSNQVLGVGIGLAILTFGYFRFLYKRRYRMIIDQFERESKNAFLQGTVYVVAYTVASFWITLVYVVPFIGSNAPVN